MELVRNLDEKYSHILETLSTPTFRIQTSGIGPCVSKLQPNGQVWTDAFFGRPMKNKYFFLQINICNLFYDKEH